MEENNNALLDALNGLSVYSDSLANIATCKDFITANYDKFDEIEFTEVINNHMKKRFGFKGEIPKQLLKFYKRLIKPNKHNVKIDMEKYQRELIEELEQETDVITINPTQDYVNEQMIYTFFKGDQPHIILSNRLIIRYEDVSEFGFKLRNTDISFRNLSSSTVLDFVNGKTVSMFDCFTRIKDYIQKYVVFQEPEIYDFLSLWIIGTYMYRLFRFYPYIWINADKGSGKTRVMEVTAPLSFNSQMATNQTQSTIFRSVESDGCTLFIDEYEKMASDVQQGIETILNSGFNIDGKTMRTERVGDGHKTKTFNTYSPKVFAGINSISDVLQDRCIKIRMLKKSKVEKIERYKVDDSLKDNIESLRGDLYILGLQCANEIHDIYSSSSITFPDELSDRECDIWEVIFTIANYIDINNDTTLQGEMKGYAIKTSKERSKDNIEKNTSYKLLNSLNEILPCISPLKTSEGIKYYSSNELYIMLTANDDLEWVTSPKLLTRELKNRFSIDSRRLTIHGEKIRTYGISEKYLKELLERYNLLDVSADDNLTV